MCVCAEEEGVIRFNEFEMMRARVGVALNDTCVQIKWSLCPVWRKMDAANVGLHLNGSYIVSQDLLRVTQKLWNLMNMKGLFMNKFVIWLKIISLFSRSN